MRNPKFTKAKVCRIPAFGDAFSFPPDIEVVVDVLVSDEALKKYTLSKAHGNWYKSKLKITTVKMKTEEFNKVRAVIHDTK